MSLRPGIGAGFVAKYGSDMFPHNRVVANGHESPIPRYYNALLDRVSPLYAAEMRARRLDRADAESMRLESLAENKFVDLRRSSVQEAVKEASIRLLKRSM